jgi:hypothetical protein
MDGHHFGYRFASTVGTSSHAYPVTFSRRLEFRKEYDEYDEIMRCPPVTPSDETTNSSVDGPSRRCLLDVLEAHREWDRLSGDGTFCIYHSRLR